MLSSFMEISFLIILPKIVSEFKDDNTMWPLSIIITDLVFFPQEASTSMPCFFPSCIILFIGAESGFKTDIILPSATKFPNPMFKSFKVKPSFTLNLKNNPQENHKFLVNYQLFCIPCISTPARTKKLEAPPRLELGIKVLQTSALPLGYGAIYFIIFKKIVCVNVRLNKKNFFC